ncbi:MAG: N-acetylneuraminate synthase family protein, partial [Dehalococcoidia bacterium]|nr:N-acetylneuraminate synthase family protein [Dehalococcoidia bacterium]
MSVLVISDPGGTHDGQLDRMYRLIDAAAAAGANVMKFQFTSSPERLAERRHAPEYVEAYQKLAFPRDWLPHLAARCENRDVEFACTVYLASDLPVIAPFVKRFKIASFEARDSEFLRAHGSYAAREARPGLIVSTGAMDADEVDALDRVCSRLWAYYALLHCVSAYPAPPEDMNLWLLGKGEGERRAEYSGLSDHSCSPIVAAMAVARG